MLRKLASEAIALTEANEDHDGNVYVPASTSVSANCKRVGNLCEKRDGPTCMRIPCANTTTHQVFECSVKLGKVSPKVVLRDMGVGCELLGVLDEDGEQRDYCSEDNHARASKWAPLAQFARMM